MTAGTLNQPTNVTASSTTGSGTVGVSWTASVTGSGTPTPQGYYVTRIDNSNNSVTDACGTHLASPVNSTSCSDTSVPNGTYHYVVIAIYHTWTAPSASSNNVTVTNDTTPPTVVSINRVDSSPTNASTVHWTVTFSESVTGVDSTDFSLVGAGATGASITGVSGSGSSYTVTVGAGSDGTLGLNLVDDDTIRDLTGNKLGGTGTGNGNFTTGQTYLVDRTGRRTRFR